MFATNADDRKGLLVAVITGGRPKLKERPVRKFLPQLREAGFTNIVWVVAEHHAPEYERDEFDLCVYPSQWAYDYAASHWMSTDPVPPVGGFHGAFPGREWACLEAERRGCWGVLQLDDNIDSLYVVRGDNQEAMKKLGGMGAAADILAGVALSTNGRMVGAQLSAVARADFAIARTGFCYSLFIEKVGEGREHWYGPFEDDITHAYQYGTRADGAVPVVVPLIRYQKHHGSKTGMRAHYNHKRSLQLQRIFPETAKINVRKTRSNGMGEPRIFHTMLPTAIRNRLVVKDQERFRRVQARLQEVLDVYSEVVKAQTARKIQKRIDTIRQGDQKRG